MKTIKTAEAVGTALDWLVAKAKGHELMLFDTLWRDNAALKGYPEPDVERHLQWQPQRGRHVIIELRGLQLDQRNLEVLTPTRCAVDIPGYSTDWAQGGPIIEREGVNLSIDYQDDALSNDMVQLGWKGNLWNNSVPGTAGFLQWAYGPTPLIAAMRCFCCSKLGETVEVPEELT